MQTTVLPVLLFVGSTVVLAGLLLALANLFNPGRPSRVKRMPYESGMDPVHDTRRRFDVRFHLLAIAFLVFDVELLFLYPWAIELHSARPEPAAVAAVVDGVAAAPAVVEQPWIRPAFAAGLVFFLLLTLGFVYDWRKGVFRWR